MPGSRARPIRSPRRPAFAAAATAHGARIRTGQQVIAIDAATDGFAVRTAHETHHARRVVNAAGINAGRWPRMVGASIDIQAFAIQLSVTEPAAPLIKHLVYCVRDRLTMKQTKQGSILIGGGWPALVDERGRAQVSAQSLARNLKVAVEIVPDTASLNIVRTWAAIVNGTHDWMPMLGELPRVPGYFLNYVPWMGFTGAPAAGRIVASLAQGKLPPLDLDLAPFQARLQSQCRRILLTNSCVRSCAGAVEDLLRRAALDHLPSSIIATRVDTSRTKRHLVRDDEHRHAFAGEPADGVEHLVDAARDRAPR